MNVALLVEMVAEGAPHRVIVGTREGGLTAEVVLAKARSAGRTFLAAGAQHVGFLDLNSAAFPVAMLGAASAGIPFAPVNYRLTDDQLSSVLRQLAPGVVVAGPEMVERAGSVEGIQVITTEELMSGDPATPSELDLPFVDPEEIAVLLFTSGTTGEPKAAVLRHRHLTSYIIGTVEFLSAGEDEAQLVCVPLVSHRRDRRGSELRLSGAGGSFTCRPSIRRSGCVWPTTKESRRPWWCPPCSAGYWPYWSSKAPSFRRSPCFLRRRPDAGGADRAGHAAVAPCRLRQRLRLDRDQLDHRRARRRTTIGIAWPAPIPRFAAVSVRLAGRCPRWRSRSATRRASPCRPATGARSTCGASRWPANTWAGSALVDDGWFPTNDAGWLDDEGFLFLEGRLDDVIVRGARTFRPARSKTPCWNTRRSPKRRSSACPTRSGERRSPPLWCSKPGQRSPRTNSGPL